jgi:hypothetical protein
VELIMLDTEGGEENALLGARETIARCSPNIVFEIHRNFVDWSAGLQNTSVVTFLTSQGYDVFAIRDFHNNYPMAMNRSRSYPSIAFIWMDRHMDSIRWRLKTATWFSGWGCESCETSARSCCSTKIRRCTCRFRRHHDHGSRRIWFYRDSHSCAAGSAGPEHQAVRRDDPMPEGPLGHVIYCIGLTADFRSRTFDTVEAHVCTLLDVLRRGEFESIVYLSSTRLYAGSDSTSEETSIRISPFDVYNTSKLAGESLVLKLRPARASG